MSHLSRPRRRRWQFEAHPNLSATDSRSHYVSRGDFGVALLERASAAGHHAYEMMHKPERGSTLFTSTSNRVRRSGSTTENTDFQRGALPAADLGNLREAVSEIGCRPDLPGG